MSKPTIEILGQRYPIPEMSARLEPLRDTIHQSVEVVRQGRLPAREVTKVVEEPGFMGLWASEREVVDVIPGRALSVEERFEKLGQLVNHYHELLHELTRNKEAYTNFLSQIEDGSLRVVRGSLERQRGVVLRLLEQAQRIRLKGKDDLLQKNLAQQERVAEAVRVTIKAGLLIISKIDVCRKGILALVEDQNTQLKLLEKMREDLGLTLEVYMMDKEVAVIVEQAQELAQVAMEFDHYLEAYMGPLHALLSEAGRVDESVARAIHQVESLTDSLTQGSSLGAVSLDAGYQPVLELLVQGNLRQDQIQRLVDEVRQKDIEDVAIDAEILTDEASLEQAITNAALFFDTSHTHTADASRRRQIPSAPPRLTHPDATALHNLGGFTPIPAGHFMMGTERGREDERPRRQVTLNHPLWVGVTPVTQDQWLAVMGANPSRFKGGRRPVENVNWFMAVAYCNARSRMEGLDECYEVRGAQGDPSDDAGFRYEHVQWRGHGARGYRLLTEAEWEYACRAGSQDDHYGELDAIAWHGHNSDRETHDVRLKRPNAWGLHDMLGNVWEWTADWYGKDYYAQAPAQDPTGPEHGSKRVLRGGCLLNLNASYLRAANRSNGLPGDAYFNIGFRCAKAR